MNISAEERSSTYVYYNVIVPPPPHTHTHLLPRKEMLKNYNLVVNSNVLSFSVIWLQFLHILFVLLLLDDR